MTNTFISNLQLSPSETCTTYDISKQARDQFKGQTINVKPTLILANTPLGQERCTHGKSREFG